MKSLVTLLVFFISFFCNAQSTDAKEKMQVLLNQLLSTPKYECDITIKINVKFINMKERSGKMIYHSPEKIDYKKLRNKREFIPSSNGVFIGREGDIVWSNESKPYMSDMGQEWFSTHPNNIVELEIIYNQSNFKEPTFDIVTKKKCIYIGSLSKSLSDSIRYLFSPNIPPRFENIFMVGTTTKLIEESTKFKEIKKYIETNPKVIFYPNVVGILKPRV